MVTDCKTIIVHEDGDIYFEGKRLTLAMTASELYYAARFGLTAAFAHEKSIAHYQRQLSNHRREIGVLIDTVSQQSGEINAARHRQVSKKRNWLAKVWGKANDLE